MWRTPGTHPAPPYPTQALGCFLLGYIFRGLQFFFAACCRWYTAWPGMFSFLSSLSFSLFLLNTQMGLVCTTKDKHNWLTQTKTKHLHWNNCDLLLLIIYAYCFFLYWYFYWLSFSFNCLCILLSQIWFSFSGIGRRAGGSVLSWDLRKHAHTLTHEEVTCVLDICQALSFWETVRGDLFSVWIFCQTKRPLVHYVRTWIKTLFSCTLSSGMTCVLILLSYQSQWNHLIPNSLLMCQAV